MPKPNPKPFLHSLALSESPSNGYPFSIPAIASLKNLKMHPKVTFFIGENGSGKSTLLEAIAVSFGYNAEGGGRNEGGPGGDIRFSSCDTHSELHRHLLLDKSPDRPSDGYFLR